VSFSNDLNEHPDSAFALVRNATETVTVHMAWSSDHSRATLTFDGAGGSLADGRYTLSIDGNQLAGSNGVPIDADGDGQPGGVSATDVYRYFGDGDGDADVDFTDLANFRQALGNPTFNPIFDYDGDADADFTDLAQFRLRLGALLPP
jgi:hypothetical protein